MYLHNEYPHKYEDGYGTNIYLVDRVWESTRTLPARDGNESGRARIVPTRNPTRQKKSTRYPPIYPSGIRLKNTREYF